jgi:hypothetical protein
MIRIGLISRPGILDRILPDGSDGTWAGRHFSPVRPGGVYDWVVVLHRTLLDPTTVVGDPKNTAYVSMEPQERRTIGRGYLDQFSLVLATDPTLKHPGLIRRSGLGWWVGRSGYRVGRHGEAPGARWTFDELRSTPLPPKADRVSIVTSSLRQSPGHVARDRLIGEILRHPISRHVDLFGAGRRPISDKWDAIAPSKYHLALENSVLRDYWTEKLSDAYLGFALPLYFGCPNIGEYFPDDSYIHIDAQRPRAAIAVIERVLDEDLWTARLPAILEARLRVLDHHHPLTVIAQACDRPALTQERFELLPPDHFPPGRLEHEWWRFKRGIYRRTRAVRLGGHPLWRYAP